MNYFPFSVGYVKGPPTPPVIAVNKPWHYVLFQLHSEDDGYILPTLTVNLTFHVSYLSLYQSFILLHATTNNLYSKCL